MIREKTFEDNVSLDPYRYPSGFVIVEENMCINEIIKSWIRHGANKENEKMDPMYTIWNSPEGEMYRQMLKLPTFEYEFHSELFI